MQQYNNSLFLTLGDGNKMLKGIAILKLYEIGKCMQADLSGGVIKRDRQICRCEVFTNVVIVIA